MGGERPDGDIRIKKGIKRIWRYPGIGLGVGFRVSISNNGFMGKRKEI